MISFQHKGDFEKSFGFLKKLSRRNLMKNLEEYGRRGVDALSAATPQDTGATAQSWSYQIKVTDKSTTIHWLNSHLAGTIPVAILIQYGHGTRNGGYVQGRDFINPALQPIFDAMVEEIWREVAMSE